MDAKIANLVMSVSKPSVSLQIQVSAKGPLSGLQLDDEGKSPWLVGLKHASVKLSSHEIIDAVCNVFET